MTGQRSFEELLAARTFEELLAARTKTLNDIQVIIKRIRYLVDLKVAQTKLEQQWQKAKL
jgi:hypothetical protein